MGQNTELKTYQILANLRGRLLNGILQDARTKFEYGKPEDCQEMLGYIANPAKWDYCGLMNKEDKAVLETLEYLLNDELKEIRPYKKWEPVNRN